MIANARMYAINPATAAAWRTLLQWVIDRARVSAEVIEYPAPQPLKTLWERSDLGGVFMCGFPFSQLQPQRIVLAAPVPNPSAYNDEPVYWSDLVTRADAPFVRLEDTFGQRIAFTTPESQSGYQAPRRFLAEFAKVRGPLFTAAVGPLITPRRVIEAVLAGDADVGPLDSYVHALLRVSEPALAARLRVIATTSPTPIPPLVASPEVGSSAIARLRQALLDVAGAGELAAVRDVLALRRFAPVAAASYDELQRQAAMADAAGYRQLG